MLPTPDISHLGSGDYDKVYEPAEDTFLFLDALEMEEAQIKENCPSLCLEIGSGSGVVSTFLAKMLGSQAAYFTTDINLSACEVTARTATQNHVHISPVLCDLAGTLLSRLQGQVDVLLFNPPYAVTPSEEVGSHGIEASWAGGVRGREVTDRFLPKVKLLLSERGVFYLVVIEENDRGSVGADFVVLAELAQILGADGFSMSVVLERRSGPEKLAILKFSRKPPDGSS